MPFFPQAQNTIIFGGMFKDVQGNMLVQHGDPLLQALYPETATGATYNSKERYPPPRCYPGTRKAILEEIDSWAADEPADHQGSVMWVHGPAGAGKSAIAQTICESSAGRGQLAASFFFSRDHARRDSVDYVINTVALQLAMSTHDMRDEIAMVVYDNPSIVHEAMTASLVERLIVRPMKSRTTGVTATRPPFLVVIDGLDECKDNEQQTLLLENLAGLVRTDGLPLRILVVSRPEPHIEHFFHNIDMCNFRVLSMYGDYQAAADIYSFLKDEFDRIHDMERHSAVMASISKPWPSKLILDILVDKSGGYFIYASTVLQFVAEEHFSPAERLHEVINTSPTSPTTAFAELDRLYMQILSTSQKPALLKRILGCVLLPVDTLNRGVTLSMIETLLNLPTGEVMLALRGLHSLLSFGENEDAQIPLPSFITHASGEIHIRSLHASFGDFVFSKERSGAFFVDMQEHHIDMVLTIWKCFGNWDAIVPPSHMV
ncbi:hypothetical protein FPV67DRAFT_1753579 [Lyophyllum atratum]|nr:hypothetical protein FPV67DRAFT_1753579 [Lyophyllum atratum]